MARQNVEILAFNRGIVSRYALGRIDLKRMQYSAEIQTNWMPRTFGPMMLRPGLEYVGFRTRNNAQAVLIPFIRATNDAQMLEATNLTLRPIVNEAPVVRPSVATAIVNGTFAGSIAGWVVADQAGAASAYDAPNQLGLRGTGGNDAITYQAITVLLADQAKEHGIRIVVNRGPVMLRIGTGIGLDDLQRETSLGVGTHSLGITPGAATFYIYFFNRLDRTVDVGSVAIEAPGTMTLPASWKLADLPLLRWTQSADVLYICDGTHQQLKIERRAPNSWSIVLYEPENGPFLPINFSPTSITPSDISGDITLTANSPLFNPKHVGGLFRFASQGQDVSSDLGGAGQFTDTIRVTGVGVSRNTIDNVSGTWVGTLWLQRSDNPTSGFVNVVKLHNEVNRVRNDSFDGFDNQITYYRIEMTAWTSGVANVELSFTGGSANGVARVTGYTDTKTVDATVLAALGGATATTTWYEGAWSDFRGWPTSLALYGDRLWNFGLGAFWGSIVDAYEGFDDLTPGDSGPISRTIGKGPVDWVNWGLALSRLIVGTDGTLVSARSDSIDTPLTPTNFNLKWPVSQGAARLAPCAADDNGYFVHRNLVDVYELAFDTTSIANLDYGATRLTALCPEVCQPGIVKIVIQRQPDTRLHAILSDGTVAICVRDNAENVEAWVKVETPGAGGFVEDAVVLPRQGYEDAVYYIVKRTIGGVDQRFYEKWAQEADCVGGPLNLQADCFVTYTGAPVTTLPAIAPHLAGQHVVVWGDGKDMSPGPTPTIPQTLYLVAGDGSIGPLPSAVSNAVVGLPYQAKFKGVKLAYAAQMGSALAQTQAVFSLGFMMADTHSHGVTYGPDFDVQDDLPGTEDEAVVPYDYIWSSYDQRQFSFPGNFSSNSRLCLVANAPRPARILAAIVTVKTNED